MKSYVLKEVSKCKFEEYFQAWKARQTGDSKQRAKSPYT
jgi:hypothetical protein